MYRCFPGYIVCVHTEEVEKSQNLPVGLDELSHPGARIETSVGYRSYHAVEFAFAERGLGRSGADVDLDLLPPCWRGPNSGV